MAKGQDLDVKVFKLDKSALLSQNALKTIETSQDVLIGINQADINKLLTQKKIKILRKLDSEQWVVRVLIPLSESDSSNITSIDPINNLWKLSNELLRNFMDEEFVVGSLTIVGSSVSDLRKMFDRENINYSIINHHQISLTSEVRIDEISDKHIMSLLNMEKTVYVGSTKGKPQIESVLNFHDLAINKVNKVHHAFTDVNGSDITVSVKEDYFDVSDIDIKSRSKTSGIESESVSPHATDMATIIGGAGNSFYKGKGAAWGTSLSSSSFENILPDDDDVFDELSISIQNHSYGFAVTDNQYGAEARAYDVNTNINKELLHVFSAGNIGLSVTDNGIYNGVEGYANLSGNFKMAKNALVVGAVDEEYQVDERNSSGPAYDGRLKPELVAFGKAGTSDAAATVSGASGLLQQYYLSQEGSLPASSLLKALLIAGADDVGADGIDFVTGYGNMNNYKSMKVIESQQYESGLVLQGAEALIDLVIPENVSEVKIVLTWNDPAANAGDATALVNNLDLSLEQMSTSITWLPWVLNSAPDANLLSQPAIREIDILNNVELVTVDKPEQGTYQIKIDGSSLRTAEQEYHIAYLYEYMDHFEWDYPVGSDKLVGGEETYIRWNTNKLAISSIEITYDAGVSWEIAASDVNISQEYVTWTVPSNLGKAQIRCSVNGDYVMSDEFFIAPILDVEVGFDCDDAFMLAWNKLDNATSYRVYEVGEKYLDLVEEITDTLYVFSKEGFSDKNYSVAPILSGASEGNTSLAFDYETQGVNCYYRSFFAENVFNEYLEIELNLSSTYLINEIIFERSIDSLNYELVTSIQPSFSQTSYAYNDVEPLTNFSFYRARIILEDNSEVLTDGIEAFFPNKETIVVSPNPVEQGGQFDLLSKGDGRLLELLDLKGRLLKQWDIQSNFTTYEVPNILKGMYLLRITDRDKTFGIKRLMVY
jgi:hypothetical protein